MNCQVTRSTIYSGIQHRASSLSILDCGLRIADCPKSRPD
ncbi:hypothetical protein D1AOALGA4SA_5037 [Olavius algarvensis Delta 1 endosymbiont]|nr:hypothetical protein D1AOALGA4SA_5037 [Olavius algarvensis Delta 1 endosymbiont]